MRLAWFLAGSAFVLLGTHVPACLAAPAAQHAGYTHRVEVRGFIAEMVERHGFRADELQRLFSRARQLPAALDAIRPREGARSWERYRSNFLTQRRIEAGVEFWRANRAALARAREQFGVPEEIILAILGVETFYGRNMGRWRVVDALTTLAFDYPQRAPYFRGELENYLVFARDTGLDVFSVQGSYAGAIGIPQFMPGSYLKFALDYDGDGVIDLRASGVDAIGSVANFLARHGWKNGEPVQSPTRIEGQSYRSFIDGGVLPKHRLEDLSGAGVRPAISPLGTQGGTTQGDTLAALVELETPEKPSEYRLGFQNFYVLTRYNRSALYAAAVADLAEALHGLQPP